MISSYLALAVEVTWRKRLVEINSPRWPGRPFPREEIGDIVASQTVVPMANLGRKGTNGLRHGGTRQVVAGDKGGLRTKTVGAV